MDYICPFPGKKATYEKSTIVSLPVTTDRLWKIKTDARVPADHPFPLFRRVVFYGLARHPGNAPLDRQAAAPAGCSYRRQPALPVPWEADPRRQQYGVDRPGPAAMGERECDPDPVSIRLRRRRSFADLYLSVVVERSEPVIPAHHLSLFPDAEQ